MEKHKIKNWTEVNLDSLNSAEKIFKAILWAETNIKGDDFCYELASLRMFFKDGKTASLMLLSI